MKKKYCIFIAFFVLNGPVMDAGDSALNTRVSVYGGSRDFGGYISDGRLVFRVIDSQAGRNADYLYRDKSDRWVSLSGSISGINLMFREQLLDRKDAEDFLERFMQTLLVSCLSNHRYQLINASLINAVDEDVRQMLDRYARRSRFLVNEDAWKIDFALITDLGGVEVWSVEGRTFPLQVRQFSRELVEPDGRVKPPLQF